MLYLIMNKETDCELSQAEKDATLCSRARLGLLYRKSTRLLITICVPLLLERQLTLA